MNKTNTLLNFTLMVLLLFGLIIFQSSLWPTAFFGSKLNFLLWLPYLNYWMIYRRPFESVLMLYFLTICVSTTSSIPTSYLLIIHCLLFLILIPVKRLYYINWKFYSVVNCIIVFFFPILLWCLLFWIDKKKYLAWNGLMDYWRNSYLCVCLYTTECNAMD